MPGWKDRDDDEPRRLASGGADAARVAGQDHACTAGGGRPGGDRLRCPARDVPGAQGIFGLAQRRETLRGGTYLQSTGRERQRENAAAANVLGGAFRYGDRSIRNSMDGEL